MDKKKIYCTTKTFFSLHYIWSFITLETFVRSLGKFYSGMIGEYYVTWA